MRRTADIAARLPGPPELLPGCPDAVIDLQTEAGVALVGGAWRYSDARVERDRVRRGRPPEDPLGPGITPNRTYDVVPMPRLPTTTTRTWRTLVARGDPASPQPGRVCFNWYRIDVTIPERVGDLDPTGCQRRVRGRHRRLRRGVGQRRAAARARRRRRPGRRRLQRTQPCAPDRRRPSRSALPDRRVRDQRADLGLAAQLHLDAHGHARLLRPRAGAARSRRPSSRSTAPTPALDAVLAPDATLERVAGGFEFTEGPVWSPRARCCSARRTRTSIYRWHPSRPRDGVPLQERLQRRRHRPLPPARLERAHVRPAGPADDLPARQPPGDPRRAARQHHGARRPLRRAGG